MVNPNSTTYCGGSQLMITYDRTWYNNQGNREMYMNCAVVTIDAPRRLGKRNLSGPDMFIANIGNGCSTPAGTDVVFPNPGPDVKYGGNSGNQAAPVGNCGTVLYTPPPPSNDNGGNDNNGGNDGGNTGGDNTGTIPFPNLMKIPKIIP